MIAFAVFFKDIGSAAQDAAAEERGDNNFKVVPSARIARVGVRPVADATR